MKVNVTATATKSVMARLLNRQLFYRTLAVLATGLGMVGVILPLLPTTPFLIVAVWAAGKSSPRLELWLLEHPQFGPLLKGWRDRGAIPVLQSTWQD